MSMRDIAIRVEGLGKRYRLGEKVRYRTLRESWRDAFKQTRTDTDQDTIWALRDVSFEVKRGEVIGVIGRNGAGKSTLLKLLSRITRPTTGSADIYGRVGSLLEVGTGFHPELTGRENIYLNGAVLGMTRHEVNTKFDEIVTFAEIDRFLDTPVKRYSSGMFVRLAFAVAAHLEPDILVVDEVLAVGDADFQKKCLGKMGDVAGHGRTVLFVSHNMSAVSALCERCMLLTKGQTRQFGPTDEVVTQYLSEVLSAADTPLSARTDRQGSGLLRFTGLKVFAGTDVDAAPQPANGMPATIALDYESQSALPLKNVRIAVLFSDEHGVRLFACDTQFTNADFAELPRSGRLYCFIPRFSLASGSYQLQVWAMVSGQVADLVENAGLISVQDGDFFGTGRSTLRDKHGPFLVEHEWTASADHAQLRSE